MRHLLLLMIAATLLTSCMTMEQMTSTEIIDYSRFEKNGLYVTEANNVNFNYTPVGSIISVTRGAFSNFWSFSVDKDKAFTDIGKKLKSMGADGLINMKITNTFVSNFYYMTITGMAIKRENVAPAAPTTFKERLGNIDGIDLEVLEAYSNGTKILTTREMDKDQIRKAAKRFFFQQRQVQFYTEEGWKKKEAYAAIIDSQIIDYKTNEFFPL